MRGFFLGLAVGAGAALGGRSYWQAARPAAKKALRAGIEGYIAARRNLARMAEEVEDLVAEVSHEMAEAAAEADKAAAGTSAASDAQ